MFVPQWLYQFQRCVWPHRARDARNAARRASIHRPIQPRLESLEDRLTPSDLSLTAGSIAPNLSSGTAQVSLTGQVSNSGGTVNEGTLSFTVGGVSGKGNVSDGTASAKLTVPIQTVLNGFTVSLSYNDTTLPSLNTSMFVSTSIWNGLLSANLTFDSGSNQQQVQFTMGSQSLFGASYSLSNGLLSQIQIGSSSMPVRYEITGNSMVAAVGDLPLGVILYDGSGQFVGTADVGTAADGTPQWSIYDTNNQLVAGLPYDG